MGSRKPQSSLGLLLGEGTVLGSIFRLQNHVQMSISSLLLGSFSLHFTNPFPSSLVSRLAFHVSTTLVFEE